MNAAAHKIKAGLEAAGVSVKYDNRDNNKPGWKFADYELKGVPLRIAIGPRDLENGTVELARRDTLEKVTVPAEGLTERVISLLDEIQENIYKKAFEFRTANTYNADTWEEFVDIIENKGGFVMAHWDGTTETEEKIKDETKATIRCIPFDSPEEAGNCVYSGKPSSRRVLFARSY